MILDKEIEIIVGSRHIKYYSELGYKCKFKEKIIVKIEHLSKGSHVIIKVKCDDEKCPNAQEIRFIKYQNYIKTTKNFTETYCCNICALKKIEQTNINKFGTKNVLQNEDIKRKIKETLLKNYGVENPSQNEYIKHKKIKTSYANWGQDNPSKNEFIKNKKIETNRKNWQNDFSLQNKDIRKKGEETKEKLYGNKNYTNSEKMKKTNNEIYGGNSAMCSEKIQKKSQKTCLKHFNVSNPMQDTKINEKQQIKSKKLKLHEKTGLKYRGTYEKHFLDYCFENNIKVESAKTIKYEFKNKNKVYFPDFYLKNKNLIIEIKSDYTYKKDLEKNLAKQKACLDQGYDFIFIINKNYDKFLCLQ